ncbi:MAG TPA: phycobiliprotein lyase [Synechococcales cyanobacterium M55_K2018_004]|nr:phycobiliprotein lyase [Synechococcales cyanobacterium M55_K2018_004]
MNVMEFFELSTGKWRSLRTTHHLPFRCAEAGESEIYVEALPANNPKVVEICELHQFNPKLAIGGAFVSWAGQMGWDKEDENHSGSTIFALIPDADQPQKGLLLRERGYAETIPVAGQYEMDGEGALVLTTEYETMSTIERFWFPSPSLRMRTSTVKRFGGFSTATFCTEFRVAESSLNEGMQSVTPPMTDEMKASVEATKYLFTFGW